MVIYHYDKAANFWHLKILIKLCITDGRVLSSWPKSPLYLADCESTATYKNPQINAADCILAGAISFRALAAKAAVLSGSS